MRINSVRAKNFRTLENFELDFNSHYCTLSGQNNAGKSAVVRIIQHFLENADDNRFFESGLADINWAKDKTQWVEEGEIELFLELEIERLGDAEVFYVIEKLSSKTLLDDKVKLIISQIIYSNGSITTGCDLQGEELEGQASSEVFKKIRSVANLAVHNSTRAKRSYYYQDDGFTEVLDVHLSDGDRKRIATAEKNLQKRVRSAAAQHKEALSELLGKLNERYQVELTTLDRGASSRFPLSVILTDKSVEVPLPDWGAGTQNRTRVLISILDALRIRSSELAENRSTPVVLVEEPESFLHPSAQAEFGKVLNELAEELKIQIIATTHSPYMLNQSIPSANILLSRKVFRNKLKETCVENTSGENWMLPFAENLGVIPEEFSAWKSVVASNQSRVILVEGVLDQEYFQHIQEKYPDIYQIEATVEIVPYDGKDALKNTQLLRFMLSKFTKVFITFDLDAEREVETHLQKIGLSKGADYCAIGKSSAGADCIEGLLPDRIKKAVFGREVELVTTLTSADNKARRSARSSLKNKLLEEMKNTECTANELSDFKKLFKDLAKSVH